MVGMADGIRPCVRCGALRPNQGQDAAYHKWIMTHIVLMSCEPKKP